MSQNPLVGSEVTTSDLYPPVVLLGDVDDVAVLHHVVRDVAPTEVVH